MARSASAKAPRPGRGRSALLTLAAALMALPIGVTEASAQLRGHGGPVRALAVSADGQIAISGSFDSTAIRWSLTRNAAEQVLRFHSDAVNAVVLLADGRAATAGADGRIAIWTFGKAEPDKVLEGHSAPIVALAASPNGATLASASWDRTVRLWPLAGGAPRVLDAPWSALATTSAFESGHCQAPKRQPWFRYRPRSTPWPPAPTGRSRWAVRTARFTF